MKIAKQRENLLHCSCVSPFLSFHNWTACKSHGTILCVLLCRTWRRNIYFYNFQLCKRYVSCYNIQEYQELGEVIYIRSTSVCHHTAPQLLYWLYGYVYEFSYNIKISISCVWCTHNLFVYRKFSFSTISFCFLLFKTNITVYNNRELFLAQVAEHNKRIVKDILEHRESTWCIFIT